MNLEDKIVTITAMSVNTYPPESIATVVITKEVFNGVFKNIETFTMKFDFAFHSISDPALLALIHEKLSQLPD